MTALTGARFTPVLVYRGGMEWPGPPVATEAEAREALADMLGRARSPVTAARIDVSGRLTVPLRDLVGGR